MNNQSMPFDLMAEVMSQFGRNGDTMLAHINPQEAMILKAYGGSGTINPVTGLPEFFWDDLWEGIKDVGSSVVDSLFGSGSSGGSSVIGDIVSGVGDFIGNVGGGIADTAGDIWDWGSDAVSGVWDWTKDTAGDIWDWGSNTAGDIWDWGSDAVSGVWDWTKDTAGDIWDWTKDTASGAWDWLTGLFGGGTESEGPGVWDSIKNIFGNMFGGGSGGGQNTNQPTMSQMAQMPQQVYSSANMIPQAEFVDPRAGLGNQQISTIQQLLGQIA